jgi:VWFA-related protein
MGSVRTARRRSKTGVLSLAAGLALTGTSASQAPPDRAAADQPIVRAGTAAVLLDVVIRDKKGRPVPDIAAAEVEVLEDGVAQKIEGFRWVETQPMPVAGAGVVAPALPDARRQPNLVSLVFDQLGPDGRRLASKAASAFLERGLRPDTWVAVFQIDQRLALVQPFTNDAARLKNAVAKVTAGTYRGILDEQAAMEQAQKEAEAAASAPDTAEGRGPPASGGAFASRVQAQAIANMLRLSSALQRQQAGTTSLYPLLALVRGHETLPGRKTLVYLSEGLQVPPNLEAVFRSTISAANRANVSIYAIDARGLNVDRAMGASAEALDQARRVSQRAMESRGAGAVGKDEVQLADTAESALRLNVEQTLADLSESTGGFLIASSNDFKQGAERLAADLSGHYELTYTPPAVVFDGRFRAIEVKVARKGVVVQARTGYFALPTGESAALFAYEVPLLAALGQPAPPRDLAIQAAALGFEDGPAGREHRLILETRVGGLKMIEDRAKKTYRVHFSLLALVKDGHGAVVERFSEDFPFEGPLAKADLLKLGNIVFKRRLTLPPGSYVLEAAGQDREMGKLGVTRKQFEVPGSCGGAGMSSVVLIRRVDPVPPRAEKADDPLDVGGVRVVPNLDLPISLAANHKLSLFVIVYPRAEKRPRMDLEFWRDGKAIARAQPELPPSENDGKIRYVGTFPIEKFQPGAYEVRVALSEATRCEERAAFTLVP